MATTPVVNQSRWYRSFYWRIGVAFVVFVILVIIAQSVMFSYRMARRERAFDRSPNTVATTAAADLGFALVGDPNLDLGAHLRARYGREPWGVFVVMKDGRTAGSSPQPLPDEIRQSAAAVLAGIDPRRAGRQPRISGPVVTAPIQVAGDLRGMIVLPPPPPGGVLRDVGRLLSLPGTLVLMAATAIAAVVIFWPARRRLRALEEAAARLGSGDLAARAPEGGGDEMASVARAFNRMAAELAARDAALRTSDRLRRQMLADVSHELKTPLTSMRGYLETLRMPEFDADEARRERYIATIERETRRLEKIVADLLDLARYENGVGSLDLRLFAIERLFDHVIRRHERDAQARNVAMRMRIAPAADQVLADPDRIEQVIENLVSNAMRHTPTGGTVELGAGAVDDTVRLSVVDSGGGIPPEHVPHVFDRFYKADGSRAPGSGGSGLGLSIARAIVERHGGSIEVTSEPGRTAFTVVLPQPPPTYSASTNL